MHTTLAVRRIITASVFVAISTMAASGIVPTRAGAEVASTDMAFLLSRIKQIEFRLDRLEAAAGIDSASSDAVGQNLPVLEVRSREDCVPCQAFRSDAAKMKNLPVRIKYLSQSEWSVPSVPSFRYRTANGVQRNRVGYRPGDLQSMIDEMTE